jgi:pimeloyl-ACP methyl ester carboxylesterase
VQALADSLARAGTGATGLAARYDEAVTRAIVETRDRSRMMTFLRAYAGLTTLPPDAATLRALAADHLPPEDAAAAIAIVDLMSPGDVAETFAAVARDMRRVIAPFVALIDLDVVSCQEAVPFNTRQGYDAVNARLKFPFILDAEDGAAALFYGTCAGVPPAPRPGHHEPVTSDIPALVLYGLADTQTAAADARSTAEHLRRAQALAVPEAGHGALIFSQCVKDIGMAFVERPGEVLDTACLERLKPRWVLPRP